MNVEWTQFTKLTEDPKLAYLERLLDERGIEHRRNGHGRHAPIMEVPEDRLDEAWALLDTKVVIEGVPHTLDDIEDDHWIITYLLRQS